MEGQEIGSKNKALKSQVAIRCAKATLLLFSLGSSPNRCKYIVFDNIQEKKGEEILKMKKEVDDLKLRLMRERHKNKRIKLFFLLEIFLFTVLICFSTFICLIAF